MKVALYCRISTNKQEIENQLIQLRDFCKKSNYQIYHEYADIISGKETSRPAFSQLFKDAHKKLFDIVLFWDLSRFSRAGTLHTLQKLQELRRLGIDWISYQEPLIQSLGEFGDIVIAIMSTLAKIEREKISSRTKAGLKRALSEGKKLGRPKISVYQKNRVIQLYNELHSINKVAQKVHISYGKCWSIIKKGV